MNMTVYQSINDLIGQTPLLEITNFSLPKRVRLFAKLEFYNPGGSVKDRLGQALIYDALAKGHLKEGGTIIEPTAGNTGIGLAISALNKDLSVIFCVPEHFSQEKQDIMRAIGATVIHTSREAGMQEAIDKTNQLLQEVPNSCSPQQFDNEDNPDAYYQTLAPEIWNDLQGGVDVYVAGAGSGRTFMGVAHYLKERNRQVRTVIVE